MLGTGAGRRQSPSIVLYLPVLGIVAGTDQHVLCFPQPLPLGLDQPEKKEQGAEPQGLHVLILLSFPPCRVTRSEGHS